MRCGCGDWQGQERRSCVPSAARRVCRVEHRVQSHLHTRATHRPSDVPGARCCSRRASPWKSLCSLHERGSAHPHAMSSLAPLGRGDLRASRPHHAVSVHKEPGVMLARPCCARRSQPARGSCSTPTTPGGAQGRPLETIEAYAGLGDSTRGAARSMRRAPSSGERAPPRQRADVLRPPFSRSAHALAEPAPGTTDFPF